MKLSLVTHSPDIETMIATSMLTTTSGAMPSTLYKRLKDNPEKVAEIVGRVEVQHGNILEHNRLVWRMEATRDDVLDILLRSKFFNITEAGEDDWLLSCNLRTIAEYHQEHPDEFSNQLIESIQEAASNVYNFIKGDKR